MNYFQNFMLGRKYVLVLDFNGNIISYFQSSCKLRFLVLGSVMGLVNLFSNVGGFVSPVLVLQLTKGKVRKAVVTRLDMIQHPLFGKYTVPFHLININI